MTTRQFQSCCHDLQLFPAGDSALEMPQVRIPSWAWTIDKRRRTSANFVLTLSCDDRKGIVAAVANAIADQDCNIVESAQFGDPVTNRFFMRVAFSGPDTATTEVFGARFRSVASEFGLQWQIHDTTLKPRVMILVSKIGHCLNDLLYRNSVGQLPMELVAVVSNHETFARRVEGEGIPYIHLPVSADTRSEQEARLVELLVEQRIDLVILARYMQILSDELAFRLAGKAINIHHSFLPSFKGARPYDRAHARGVKLIGATAHYVTPELDEGPIIEQDVERVDHSMSVDEFIAIGCDIEARVLARAVKSHLEHRVLINDVRTVVFR
jgi:formyltetrahydrofolate deformylase